MNVSRKWSAHVSLLLAFSLLGTSVARLQVQQGDTVDAHGRLPEATIPLSYRDGDRTWTATLVSTPGWSYTAQSRTLSIDMGNAATNDYLALRDVSRSPGCQRAITGCGPDVGGIQVYRIGDARATLADGRTIVSSNGIQFVLPKDVKQFVRLEVDINRADEDWVGVSPNANVNYKTKTLTWSIRIPDGTRDVTQGTASGADAKEVKAGPKKNTKHVLPAGRWPQDGP